MKAWHSIVLVLVALLGLSHVMLSKKTVQIEPRIDYCSRYCSVTRPHLSPKICYIYCAYGHQTYNHTNVNVTYNHVQLGHGNVPIDHEQFPVKKYNALVVPVSLCSAGNCISVMKFKGRVIGNWKRSEYEMAKIVFVPIRNIVPLDRLFVGYERLVTAVWQKLFGNNSEQVHVLTDPIPAILDDLKDHHLVRAIVDASPKPLAYYREQNITFSEAYTKFLVDVDVDPKQIKLASKSNEEIDKELDHATTELLKESEICFNQFEKYAKENHASQKMEDVKRYMDDENNCKTLKHWENKLSELQKKKEDTRDVDMVTWFFETIGRSSFTFVKVWNYDLDKLIAIDEVKPANIQITLSTTPANYNPKFFGNTINSTDIALTIGKWTEVTVDPNESWYNEKIFNHFRSYPRKSKTNYFQKGGILERKISKILVATNVTATLTINSEMKDIIILRQSLSGFKPIELGPFVFDEMSIQDVSGDSGSALITLSASQIQPFAISTIPM